MEVDASRGNGHDDKAIPFDSRCAWHSSWPRVRDRARYDRYALRIGRFGCSDVDEQILRRSADRLGWHTLAHEELSRRVCDTCRVAVYGRCRCYWLPDCNCGHDG